MCFVCIWLENIQLQISVGIYYWFLDTIIFVGLRQLFRAILRDLKVMDFIYRLVLSYGPLLIVEKYHKG